LPLGVQILGPRFGEENVFAAAGALEREVALPDEMPRGIR
jgi:Asp-tRNA(Asn)/Glu-tRNA(Gln) amidotransferase A subunit family amidase